MLEGGLIFILPFIADVVVVMVTKLVPFLVLSVSPEIVIGAIIESPWVHIIVMELRLIRSSEVVVHSIIISKVVHCVWRIKKWVERQVVLRRLILLTLIKHVWHVGGPNIGIVIAIETHR